MLDSLSQSFDYHLAQAENLSALFIALNDEIFDIRDNDSLKYAGMDGLPY